MCEQHLDLFPSAATDLKFGRGGQSPSHIARVFVDVPRNLAPDVIWAAPRFELADVAIVLARAVTAHVVSVDAGAWRGVGASELNQLLACGIDLTVRIMIPHEV